MNKYILLWDGDCNMCKKASHWFKYWDKRNEFVSFPYQEAPSPPMNEQLFASCKHGIHIVKPDGEVINKGKAAMFALERFGWGWVARTMTYPPFIWFVELGYWFIAENRPWLSNFLFTKEPPNRSEAEPKTK